MTAPTRRPIRETDTTREIEWLTVQECADELRVSKMTIYRLLHERTIPSARIGRSLRIHRAHWRRYLTARVAEGATVVR